MVSSEYQRLRIFPQSLPKKVIEKCVVKFIDGRITSLRNTRCKARRFFTCYYLFNKKFGENLRYVLPIQHTYISGTQQKF